MEDDTLAEALRRDARQTKVWIAFIPSVGLTISRLGFDNYEVGNLLLGSCILVALISSGFIIEQRMWVKRKY